MASSFRQWESDPLFSAAEVVQDSADRMESLFRLLSHEQSLGQENHIDVKLLKSIEYHRRDLATTLETAKWQLEDFEREVNLLATLDRSHSRENAISRYRQFIEAIREQILHVEKNLGSTSVGDLRKSIKSVNFDEQDRHGLELFLSGESPSEHVARHDLEDSNIMKRFLDPTMTSSLNDEIIEKNRGDNLNINGHVHLNHNFDLMENKLQKVDSHYSTQMNFEAPPSLQEIAPNRFVEDGGWDLEANGATGKDSFRKDRLRWYNSQRNIFGSLSTPWFTYGRRDSRSFTKRQKDGEEQMHSPTYINPSHATLGSSRQIILTSGFSCFQRFYFELFARVIHSCQLLGEHRARYQRSRYLVQVSRYSMRLTSAIILALIVLGILASQVA